MSDLPEILKAGEFARLIPVVAETSKEQRAAATLLSVVAAVDEYGRGVLRRVGAPAGKSSKIRCYTEVVFKTPLQSSGKRPDGLIVVTTGKRAWTAIVEAKVGNTNLDAAQIEAYLDIAREVGADAVITVSNQFVTVPTHHPVTVSKTKLRSVGLYHWSWTFLLTEALLH